MNPDPHSDRDRILERLLTGELDPVGDEARGLFEADPALGSEFEELRGMTEELDDAVRDEEEILAHLPIEDADERRAKAGLEAIWAQEEETASEPEAEKRPLLAWIAAAAVVLILAGVGYRFLRPGDEPPVRDSFLLSGTEDPDYAPVGAVEEFGRFSWSTEGREDYEFTLTVYRDDDAQAVLYHKETLTGDHWNVPSEEVAGWPAAILWSVDAQPPGGGGKDYGPMIEAKLTDE